MELYHTEDHFILHDGDFSLWCDRSRGTLEPKKGMIAGWSEKGHTAYQDYKEMRH